MTIPEGAPPVSPSASACLPCPPTLPATATLPSSSLLVSSFQNSKSTTRTQPPLCSSRILPELVSESGEDLHRKIQRAWGGGRRQERGESIRSCRPTPVVSRSPASSPPLLLTLLPSRSLFSSCSARLSSVSREGDEKVAAGSVRGLVVGASEGTARRSWSAAFRRRGWKAV